MKTSLLRIGSFFFFATWGMCVLAATKSVTGKVTQIQLLSKNYSTYSTAGEAIAFIYSDELPPACSSTYRRVGITSSHPAFQVVVSAAMAAQISGQSVRIHYVDKCTVWNSNAWDFSMFWLVQN